MSAIKFDSTVSLKQFAHLVATVGDKVTIIGAGEMGIGKSAVLGMLKNMMPEYETAYIDCTLLDLGDFALPYTVEENGVKVTRFAPNARFKFHMGKPVIILLDEIGKATKPVKNVLLTLINEGRIGDTVAPAGSRTFAMTNLMSEGLGDFLEPHARNRACCVKVRKPDADEWITEFAVPQALDPVLIAWVSKNAHCFAASDDPSQAENPYINKKGLVGACVTPRSMEKASHIMKRRTVLGDEVTLCALKGVIGEAAARDMHAFITIADQLPTWEAVIASPNTAQVPDDTIAKCIMVSNALVRVDKDSFGPWMQYLVRLDKEWQALFAKGVNRSAMKQSIAVNNRQYRDWALKNEYLF